MGSPHRPRQKPRGGDGMDALGTDRVSGNKNTVKRGNLDFATRDSEEQKCCLIPSGLVPAA